MSKFSILLEMEENGKVSTQIKINGAFSRNDLASIGYAVNELKFEIFDKLAEHGMDSALAFYAGTVAREHGIKAKRRDG